MTDRDLFKISKLLSLLGSNHDGEALAAGRMAHKILLDRGVTFDDLLLGFGDHSSTRYATNTPTGDQAEMIQACLDNEDLLSPWETNFMRGCWQWLEGGAGLTPKQTVTLQRIYQRVMSVI